MNVQNFDKEFQRICRGLSIDRRRPRLLLHVCCAPCATYCLTRLTELFDITLYFSNDNITDKTEWEKRLAEVYRLADIINSGQFQTSAACEVKIVAEKLNCDNFFDAVKGRESDPEGQERCKICFGMRLSAAEKYATHNGFDYFCTTLTVSPYKNSALINLTGLSTEKGGAKWLPADFKKNGGYAESIRLCAKYGIYRQRYCGCVFSETEARTKQSNSV